MLVARTGRQDGGEQDDRENTAEALHSYSFQCLRKPDMIRLMLAELASLVPPLGEVEHDGVHEELHDEADEQAADHGGGDPAHGVGTGAPWMEGGRMTMEEAIQLVLHDVP